MDLTGQHFVVVGLGDTGLASARYIAAHGARVTVLDSRDAPPQAAQLAAELPQARLFTGPFDTACLVDADYLLLSPGISFRSPLAQAFRERGGKVIGDFELFALMTAGQAGKIIAITGSNGKSTVTELTGHLCRHAGCDTVVAGNIGLPVLSALLEREQTGKMPDVWVFELSSFQLDTTYSLHADAGTVLNISEDHLDRYQDLLDYAHSKTAVFNGHGVQVLNRGDALCRAMVRAGRHVRWFSLNEGEADYGLHLSNGSYQLTVDGGAIFDVSQLPLQGLHNAANALASLALCEAIGLPRDTLLAGLKSFHGLPHRVELVDEFDGVAYIDDSKGTNVGATVAALQGMTRRVVLIAGGDGKGQDFAPLQPALARIGRAVLLIGRDAPQIRQALNDLTLPVQDCQTLEQATLAAAQLAQSGDVVLLSPACASLDMFRNYAHRAQVFCDTVAQIKQERGL